ncbi:tetratricopeptide repeat protein [Candidatus Latescibacterota bacterium]
MHSIRKPSHAAEQLKRQQKKSPTTIIIAIVAMIVAVIAVGYALYSRFGVQEKSVPSIAILCFDDMSPDRDQEHFCEGIADEIINKLTKIQNIRVIARSSAFMFKDQYPDIREIGEKLEVENVLEGSVRKEGNQIRITAQLIKVVDGSHLWSENYDRELESIFKIQDEIAVAVVEELKVELLGEEKAAIEKRYTDNIEAYNLYLQGRYHWNKRNGEGLKKGLYYFQQAVEKDPNYALAYSGIADSYSFLYIFGFMPLKEVYPKAKIAAQKAVEIDDMLAEAHASMCVIHSFDRDVSAAVRELKRALALNPNYVWAHVWYGDYLHEIGKFEEAVAVFKQAQELDPLNIILYADLSRTYHRMGRYNEAMEQCQKAIEIDPNSSIAYIWIGHIYRGQGKFELALANYKKASELDPLSPRNVANVGLTYRLLRNYPEAARYYDRAISLAPDIPAHYSSKAMLYIYWEGNIEKARAVLEEAIKNIGSEEISLIYTLVTLDVYDGNYQDALDRLSSNPEDIDDMDYYIPNALRYAHIYNLMNKKELAQASYESARVIIENKIKIQTEDHRFHSSLGIAYAGLGRKEEAIREGKLAVALLPVSKEAMRGLFRFEDLARIYVMVGEYDNAIDQLEFLLSSPGTMTIHVLRLDPIWAPLRDLPRFKALMKKMNLPED